MNNVKVYTGTLHRLVMIAREAQEMVDKRNHSVEQFIDEYCTVALRGPRGSGHSAAVLNLAGYYNAVIITQTVALGKHNYPKYKKMCSVKQIDKWARGKEASVVIIDGCGELTIEQKRVLYRMEHQNTEGFVFAYVG